MHILLLANAPLPPRSPPFPPHDLMIAADGGARHAWQDGKGKIPDVIIGDLDSLTPDEIAGYDRAGASLYRHPPAKDETDLELALDFALQHHATEITLYGLFGGRWDMTFANLLLLAAPKYAGVRLHIVEGDTDLYLLRGGETLTLHGSPGQTVSAIPLHGDATGVTYTGLTWPLQNATLPFATPRGVSNTMAAEMATITLTEGILLITHRSR
ncbi:MAG: thiamine diphosphokinase [Anaerolineales bacterium]|nr:thiamine diphosphokinase [Anaerolineales bacterium]